MKNDHVALGILFLCWLVIALLLSTDMDYALMDQIDREVANGYMDWSPQESSNVD